MTLEDEKRFLLLMSSFYLGDSATKASVLDNIEKVIGLYYLMKRLWLKRIAMN